MGYHISLNCLLLSFVFSFVLYVKNCSVVLLRCTKQLAFAFTGNMLQIMLKSRVWMLQLLINEVNM